MAFEALPPELKTMIFSNFTTSELLSIIVPVSTRWQYLAMQPILWKYLRFVESKYSSEEIVNILNHSFLAKRVAFIDFKSMLIFPKPLKTNNNLRKLELIRCRFTNDKLSKLVNAYPNVQKLSWRQSEAYLRSMSDFDAITSTITRWKFLKSLKLFDFMPSVVCNQNEMLVKIAKECTLLEKIVISPLFLISTGDGGFRMLMELRGPQLKAIELSICPPSNNVIRHLSQCQNLRKLTLYNCRVLTDTDFVSLSKFPLLKQLYLHWCSVFRHNNFSALENVKFCQLEDLYINERVDQFTEHVIKTCFPRLKKFNLLNIEDYVARLRSNA